MVFQNNKNCSFGFMDDHILKRHNKTLLLYHIVFSVKYINLGITEEVEAGLKEICTKLSHRY